MSEKSETLSIRITPELRDAIGEQADEQGLSKADYVREVLRGAAIETELSKDELKDMVDTLEEISASVDALEERLDRPFWHIVSDW